MYIIYKQKLHVNYVSTYPQKSNIKSFDFTNNFDKIFFVNNQYFDLYRKLMYLLKSLGFLTEKNKFLSYFFKFLSYVVINKN